MMAVQILLFLLIIKLDTSQQKGCEFRIGGAEAEKFFRWTMIDPVNYFVPSEFNFFCKQADGSSTCRFPQDLRSQSYWSDKNLPQDQSYKYMYHPYVYGIQGSSYPEVDVGNFYTERWVCGVIRKSFEYNNENRAKAPITMMIEAHEIVGWEFKKVDEYDAYVNTDGYCSFPCPLVIKISSPDFTDQGFNGYYVMNFPTTFANEFINSDGFGPGNGMIPSYKHLQRNLYLFPAFKDLDAINGTGRYIITENPRGPFCPGIYTSLTVSHVTIMGLENMHQRYCFSFGSILDWREFQVNNEGMVTSEKEIKRYSIERLSKQCGLTYKATENTLLGSGYQPFVVNVEVDGFQCIGTLISSMHVLTLANCFMVNSDIFDIEENVIRKCGFLSGWQNCKRWFHLNTGGSNSIRSPVQVTTFESITGASASLPVNWFEIHPLFNGQEFDLAIIGLDSYIARNVHLHPICLPDWNRLDEENKPTITKMYRYNQWEKYQTLYSLKAMHKDARFTNVWTDVNGPSKFVKCNVSHLTSDWRNHCNLKPYKDPPNLIYDSPVYGDLFKNEDPDEVNTNRGIRKYACQYFYDLLTKEESNAKLTRTQRQIRGLKHSIECFAVVTMEFPDDETQNGLKCYERRKRCLSQRGWCLTGDEFGFCSEINELPDTPDFLHPLFEVPTFILPKEDCQNAQLINSESRICTGHITHSPTEYILQVSNQHVTLSNGTTVLKAVYDVVEYISGIQRPLVRSPDSTGRVRVLDTALEGTCHGAGLMSDLDKGSPTYFRYPIEKSSNGQDASPGTAYAVLYSLQKIGGRYCDFKTYTDTEVLVAMDDVMEWISTVIMEINGSKGSPYDIDYTKVNLNIESMIVTTTTRTTNLDKTTTNFEQAWAGRYFFKNSSEETELAYPGFKLYYHGKSHLQTKPPIIFLENYDYADYISNSAKSLNQIWAIISCLLIAKLPAISY